MAVKNLLESPQAFQWVFYSLHLAEKIFEFIVLVYPFQLCANSAGVRSFKAR